MRSLTHRLVGILLLAPTVFVWGCKGEVDGDAAALSVFLEQAAQSPGSVTEEEMVAVARARREKLTALLQTNPAEVLRLALPSHLRDRLPSSVQVETEEHVDLTGTLEVQYEDHRDHARLVRSLDTGVTRYSLYMAGDAPGWTSGQQVTVRAVRIGLALALDGSTHSTGQMTQALVSSPPTGPQRTLVILVNFQNNPIEPYTAAFAAQMFFTTTSGFFLENSSGSVSVVGDVVGWYTIALDSTVCDSNTLATLARQAAANAGAVLSNYTRHVFAFPDNACSWWGLGGLGGNPSSAWINGELALEVTAHELGHNFGLYHSHSLDCGAVALGPSCTANEYGDTLDIMGSSRGHFSPFQKERLGWLSSSQLVEVASSGTFALGAYSGSGTEPRALRILRSIDSNGVRSYFYVDARRAVGYDSFVGTWTNAVSGVAIHLGTESQGNSGYLLDLTPSTDSFYDPALTVGRTFTDDASGVSVTTDSASPNGATVTVTLTTPPPTCVRGNPRLTLTPTGSTSGFAGTTLSYSAAIANADSLGCPSSTFAVTPVVPGGWTATLSATTVSIAPGASYVLVEQVTSPLSALAGTYPVGLAVVDTRDSSRSAQASVNCTVVPMPQPSLTVTPERPVYFRGSTVTLNATLQGLEPSAGVSVTFVIRKPDGRSVNGSAATDPQGVATYRLRTRNRDPVGTYRVTATSSGTTASATFDVQ